MKGRHVFGEYGAPDRYYIDGVQVTVEEWREAFPPLDLSGGSPGGHNTSCWPMPSDAMAVHPDQIPEVIERNRKRGLHVEYLPDGRPVLSDRGQRRDLMRIEGFHDRNGGYGD